MGLEAWRCSQSVSRSITRRKKSGWWGSATSPGESHLGFLVQISMVAVQETEGDPLSYWGWESFNYCRCLPEAVAGPPSAGIFAPWWAVCGCPVQNHSRDPEWEGGHSPGRPPAQSGETLAQTLTLLWLTPLPPTFLILPSPSVFIHIHLFSYFSIDKFDSEVL